MLKEHIARLNQTHLRVAFEKDPQRFARFSVQEGKLLYDYSKNLIDEPLLDALVDLAQKAKLDEKRTQLFEGFPYNSTEKRAAFHVALRDFSTRQLVVDGEGVREEINATRQRLYDYAENIRNGTQKGFTGQPFKNIVNIGIGGSDLGPVFVTQALKPYCAKHLKSYFISNVDPAHLADILEGLDPAETLFIIASKTFTTIETMTNAKAARAWLVQTLGEAAVATHFAAVSTNIALVEAFGISQAAIFGFKDWVGGRYSIWSSIALPVVIAIGEAHYNTFLQGAYAADRHFIERPLKQNIPVLMGLLAYLYRNGFNYGAQAILPYDQRLSRFPAYLQQLEMESNGKSVTHNGEAVKTHTGAIIWGEAGTNGQHAFYQLLHQGTQVIPCDFHLATTSHDNQSQHELLIANCLAQSEAMMKGRTREEAESLMLARGLRSEEAKRLAPHRAFAGNRPSSSFLYEKLDPYTLGLLIAFYEHKVFTQAVLLDINPFDQWGVELGKELAVALEAAVRGKSPPHESLDSSTKGLIAFCHKKA
jgi:glucose-6-phosphate isomerase